MTVGFITAYVKIVALEGLKMTETHLQLATEHTDVEEKFKFI